jgi:hypothetical protein
MTKRLENPTGIRSGDEKKPYVLGGKRYYHLTAAARIIGVCQTTMFKWAAKGVTGSGLQLDVYNHLNYVRLIPEETALAIRKSLRAKRQKSQASDAPNP